MPATASPGAMLAVRLITDNSVYNIQEQVVTSATMLAVLIVTLVLLLFSGGIIRIIGNGGASLLTRIMGMILAALSVEFIMEAIGIGKWVGS
ncbi:MarC family protein [Ketobacter alkanivorans]|uniref:MarC family protein n=1 Tax=Ketobacter alkanivorans TaxID=1917421 RepID=UPI0038995D31